MSPEEFITLINSHDPLNLKLAKDHMDKLPLTDPAFQDELCKLFKAMQSFDTQGKHLEISEGLRSFCAEREEQQSLLKDQDQ